MLRLSACRSPPFLPITFENKNPKENEIHADKPSQNEHATNEKGNKCEMVRGLQVEKVGMWGVTPGSGRHGAKWVAT